MRRHFGSSNEIRVTLLPGSDERPESDLLPGFSMLSLRSEGLSGAIAFALRGPKAAGRYVGRLELLPYGCER